MRIKTLIASAIAVTALTANGTTTNQNIIITATRVKSNIQNIPGNPTVITSGTLEQGGFTSAPEALQKRAGLHVRNYADNPNQASVDIRGFGENSHGRVLVLVNGRRINRPDLAPVNWTQIPMGNIERIEVARGAHTTLYGDFAVGGVINIITRRGSDSPQSEIGVIIGSHGFNDEHIATSGDLAGLGYNASLGHQSADGYRDRSAFENWSGSLGLEIDPTDYLGSWLDYSYVDSKYELPGGLNATQLLDNRRQAINQDDDVEETFNNIGLGFGLYPNEHHEVTVDLGYSKKDIESNIASFFSFNTWEIDTYGLSPKYIFSATPFEMENQLTLGADLGRDDIDISLYGDRNHSSKAGSSDVQKDTVGFYFHDALSVRKNLILSGGARTEQAIYSIQERNGAGVMQQDTSYTHNVTAYNIGITYQPAKYAKIFARYDKLYRLPFLDEQIMYAGFGSGFNKNLKPETGDAYEFGFSVEPTTNLNLQCTLFRMDMKDEIAYAVTNFTTYEGSNFNMDETRHEGIELAGNWQALQRLGFYASYTFQNVEFTSGPNNGNEVPLVPKNLLTAGLNLEMVPNLHFLTGVTFTDEQFAGSAADNSEGTKLDSYTRVDMSLRYTHLFKKIEIDLFAGIDNLFGEEYSPMAFGGFGTIYSYYPAPERTYKTGATIRF